MVGDHLAAALAGLGAGELAPLGDGEVRGFAYRGGAGLLAGLEADGGGQFELLVVIDDEGRRVFDVGAPEGEPLPGLHGDHDAGIVGNGGAEIEVGEFRAVDRDADARAEIALGVEGAEDAAVIAAALGQKPGLAGGGLIALVPERGGVLDGSLHVIGGADLDLVGERVGDLDLARRLLLALAPEMDAEKLERRRWHGKLRQRQAEKARPSQSLRTRSHFFLPAPRDLPGLVGAKLSHFASEASRSRAGDEKRCLGCAFRQRHLHIGNCMSATGRAGDPPCGIHAGQAGGPGLTRRHGNSRHMYQ